MPVRKVSALITVFSLAIASNAFGQSATSEPHGHNVSSDVVWTDNADQTLISDAGWQRLFGTMAWSGNLVSKELRQKQISVEAIYSGTSDTPGNVVFTCTHGRLSAAIAPRPVDMRAMLINPPESRDIKAKRLSLMINGKLLGGKNRKFLHMRAMDAYRTVESSQVVSLYNAVLMGSDVTFKDRDGTVSLNLPALDDEFRNFGSECKVGRNAQK